MNHSKSLADRNDLTFAMDLRRKKLVLTTEFMCLSNLNPESKMTPRFFACGFKCEDRGPRALMMEEEVSVGPKTRGSVLF